MYGSDPSASSERLDPRRRPRYARLGGPGTATALRMEGFLSGIRTALATLIASLERR